MLIESLSVGTVFLMLALVYLAFTLGMYLKGRYIYGIKSKELPLYCLKFPLVFVFMTIAITCKCVLKKGFRRAFQFTIILFRGMSECIDMYIVLVKQATGSNASEPIAEFRRKTLENLRFV